MSSLETSNAYSAYECTYACMYPSIHPTIHTFIHTFIQPTRLSQKMEKHKTQKKKNRKNAACYMQYVEILYRNFMDALELIMPWDITTDRQTFGRTDKSYVNIFFFKICLFFFWRFADFASKIFNNMAAEINQI